MHDFATIEIQEIKQTKQTVNDDLGFPLFRLFFFFITTKWRNPTKMWRLCWWQIHSVFHTILFLHYIPYKASCDHAGGVNPLVSCHCFDRLFVAEMFFHTAHPHILSVVFAATKEGAWQTVLQHGEGRPESPQQGGRGGDGNPPLFFILHKCRCGNSCFPTYQTASCFFHSPFRSCRATVYVVGGWPWWALGCCVQGASSSCCSTGCQSGASNPLAPVPQPVMLKWCCCAPQ